MKVPPKNIDGFIKAPPPGIAAVLVYGPDEGLARERADALAKTVTDDIRDPFHVAEMSAAQTTDAPGRLLDEAKALSMLGGRKVIRVHAADDALTAPVRAALPALTPEDNFIVLTAGDLGPRSSLRLLFENADNAAAVPCYVEDERDIARVIEADLKTRGFSVTRDALAHLAANVVGDRAMARREVEKLSLYMDGHGATVTLDDAAAVTGDAAALSLDDLARHAGLGQFAAADRLISKLLAEGTAAVTVLRALQNHFWRLHMTKARVEEGDNPEAALQKLRPPLFFKMRPAFEAQLSGWSLPQIEQALSLLGAAEARCKQSANDPETLCSRAVLSIAQMGARAAGRRA